MKNKTVSVVVPTYKPECINNLLEKLACQTYDCYEVIVVENGVKGADTEGIVNSYKDKIDISYIFIDKAGLNNARNVGSRLAKHDIVALIDQDIVPNEGWVEAIVAGHDLFPDAGIVGGKVELLFVDGDPGWCVGDFALKLAAVDWTPEPSVLTGWHYVVGANMSYKKSMFDKIGGFYEDADDSFFFNNELTFHEGAKKYGNPAIAYYPDMSVLHHIPKERTTLEYMVKRSYEQGYNDVSFLKYKHSDWDDMTLLGHMEYEMYCQEDFEAMKETRAKLSKEHAVLFTKNFLVCRLAYLSGLHDGIENKVDFEKHKEYLLGNKLEKEYI